MYVLVRILLSQECVNRKKQARPQGRTQKPTETDRNRRRKDPERISSRDSEKGSSRRQRERGAAGEANEEEDLRRNSGSGKDSPHQQSGGGRGWSSREYEMESRMYLDREVERRMQKQR